MLTEIDSLYLGDANRHLTLEELDGRLAALPSSPSDRGSLRFLVRRGERGCREEVDSVVLSVEEGMRGDAWSRSVDREHASQLTAVEASIAGLIANGQPLTIFGDQLFLDLDLSCENLPPGSRLRIGAAVLEVTPKYHKGCPKYRARFGQDALRFIARPDLRPRNLRGLFFRVVTDGVVQVGDVAEVIRREPGGESIDSPCR